MSIKYQKVFATESDAKALHMVGSSKFYNSFYKILPHIFPYPRDEEYALDQIFYKNMSGISDDMMRNKSGFWANILQKGIHAPKRRGGPVSRLQNRRSGDTSGIDLSDDGLGVVRRPSQPIRTSRASLRPFTGIWPGAVALPM